MSLKILKGMDLLFKELQGELIANAFTFDVSDDQKINSILEKYQGLMIKQDALIEPSMGESLLREIKNKVDNFFIFDEKALHVDLSVFNSAQKFTIKKENNKLTMISDSIEDSINTRFKIMFFSTIESVISEVLKKITEDDISLYDNKSDYVINLLLKSDNKSQIFVDETNEDYLKVKDSLIFNNSMPLYKHVLIKEYIPNTEYRNSTWNLNKIFNNSIPKTNIKILKRFNDPSYISLENENQYQLEQQMFLSYLNNYIKRFENSVMKINEDEELSLIYIVNNDNGKKTYHKTINNYGNLIQNIYVSAGNYLLKKIRQNIIKYSKSLFKEDYKDISRILLTEEADLNGTISYVNSTILSENITGYYSCDYINRLKELKVDINEDNCKKYSRFSEKSLYSIIDHIEKENISLNLAVYSIKKKLRMLFKCDDILFVPYNTKEIIKIINNNFPISNNKEGLELKKRMNKEVIKDSFVQTLKAKLISFIIENKEEDRINYLIEEGLELSKMFGNSLMDFLYNNSLLYYIDDVMSQKIKPTLEDDSNKLSTLSYLLLNKDTDIQDIDIYMNYMKENNYKCEYSNLFFYQEGYDFQYESLPTNNDFINLLKKSLYCKNKYNICFNDPAKNGNLLTKRQSTTRYLFIMKNVKTQPEVWIQLGFDKEWLEFEQEKQYIDAWKNVDINKMKDYYSQGITHSYNLNTFDNKTLMECFISKKCIELKEWKSLISILSVEDLNKPVMEANVMKLSTFILNRNNLTEDYKFELIDNWVNVLNYDPMDERITNPLIKLRVRSCLIDKETKILTDSMNNQEKEPVIIKKKRL